MTDRLPGMEPPPHACTPEDCALPCRDGADLADHARQLAAWTDANGRPLAGLMLRAALLDPEPERLADAVEYARRDLTEDWRILPAECIAEYDARIAAASPAELLAIERADPDLDPMPERAEVELEPVPAPRTLDPEEAAADEPACNECGIALRFGCECDAEWIAETAANAAAIAADPVGFIASRMVTSWRLDHVRNAATLADAVETLRLGEGVGYHGASGPGYVYQAETVGARIGTDLAARTTGPRHSWRAIAERIRADGSTLL